MKFGRLLSLLICTFLVAACALTGCGKQETTKIVVNEVTHSVFYAPQYVAMELGFFEEEGLELELVNGGGADKSMTAVLSGQAQIGLMGPEAAIYVYNEGKQDHAVVFAQLTKRAGDFLVAREPMPDFEWEDVAGSDIIGGRKGGMPEMSLEYTLKNFGLTPGEDVNVMTNIQFNLMAGAFEGGEGDYVTLFEPTASMFEQQEKGYVVASLGEDGGEIPFTAYMAKKSYTSENPEVIEKFTRAIYKGQQWVQNKSPEEIAKVLKPYFPDTGEDTLAMVAKRYKDIDAWMTQPAMTEESFSRLQDVMEMAGELDTRAPFDQVVDNTIAEKVAK